jgi:hypothetical protein
MYTTQEHNPQDLDVKRTKLATDIITAVLTMVVEGKYGNLTTDKVCLILTSFKSCDEGSDCNESNEMLCT